MVTKEALRLYPTVPFAGRKCTKKGGYLLKQYNYLIPEGAHVMVSLFAVQRDPRV